ncbi:MAG: hypothetical protein Q9183_007044, partial [Haloplaca sp. 2 TL-2023]
MAILLTGGTGKTSTRIAKLLSASSIPYVLASRSGNAPIPDSKACKFDWNDESTWSNPWSVYEDITTVWLVAAGLPDPMAVLKPFIDMARDLDIDEEEENLSEEGHLPTIRDEGKVYSASKTGQIPWVSAEDIAAVAFRGLVHEKSHDCDHVVVGPDLLSYDQ